MFLDIGIGIFLTFLVGSIFDITLTPLLFALGITFALLPDIDILLTLLPKENKIRRLLGGHRGMIHKPILYVVLSVTVFILFGKVIGTLFILGVFYHLLHDTIVLGWGIQWLWPWSQRRFKFFPDKDGKITNKFLLTWMPEDEERIQAEYGSRNWVKSFYMTVNPISIIEYSVFVIAIGMLVRHLNN